MENRVCVCVSVGKEKIVNISLTHILSFRLASSNDEIDFPLKFYNRIGMNGALNECFVHKYIQPASTSTHSIQTASISQSIIHR